MVEFKTVFGWTKSNPRDLPSGLWRHVGLSVSHHPTSSCYSLAVILTGIIRYLWFSTPSTSFFHVSPPRTVRD